MQSGYKVKKEVRDGSREDERERGRRVKGGETYMNLKFKLRRRLRVLGRSVFW